MKKEEEEATLLSSVIAFSCRYRYLSLPFGYLLTEQWKRFWQRFFELLKMLNCAVECNRTPAASRAKKDNWCHIGNYHYSVIQGCIKQITMQRYTFFCMTLSSVLISLALPQLLQRPGIKIIDFVYTVWRPCHPLPSSVPLFKLLQAVLPFFQFFVVSSRPHKCVTPIRQFCSFHDPTCLAACNW